MYYITSDQWLRVDFSVPLFYNKGTEVVTFKTQRSGVQFLVAPARCLIQLNERQAYFTRIDPDGYVKFYTTEGIIHPENFDAMYMMSLLRREFLEIQFAQH